MGRGGEGLLRLRKSGDYTYELLKKCSGKFVGTPKGSRTPLTRMKTWCPIR